MAKVSVHLGFTFRVGDLATNQYGRLDLNIDQIDTELPIDQQLDKAGQTADQVWSVLKRRVDAQIDEVLDK
ncbi:hypothetical protein CMI37_03390 [Candidatus Pacearchaeota archaeon]|nr:hypothetical protein [Candidatus Pacearchaeota archaeon]|tara:strand:+ start:587 stop:799 length:213 start_codon:yes stop_codon:yes gene_type:complete